LKIAVFSDVHGNYINLLSFYESASKLNIDKYICLGDLCNYYPDNLKVIDLIKEKNTLCLIGNHDELYISGKELSEEKKIAYNFDEKLLQSEKHILYLKSLPSKYELTTKNASILFCHASPDDLLYSYIYPDSDLSIYDNIKYNIVFIGHTHRQFIRTYKNKIFCNVGSIGLPRDNGLLLGFAIFDTETLNITLYRKKIDIEAIKSKYNNFTTPDVIEMLNRKEIINYSYTQI
jgi:putative phosphoesterase